MNAAKRVYCLYRVSTAGQVEKDDIPMQRQYCHEFVAGQEGWEITKEFYLCLIAWVVGMTKPLLW